MSATLCCISISAAGAAQLTVTAVNKLALARPNQTVELTSQQLSGLAPKELNTIHIRDAKGAELLCQAVDTDFDAYRKPDLVIFQADFAPNETKTFTVVTGPKRVYTKEQFKAFGRFVRERFDDFAWENDRIAHRMYGKGLENWAGEPLTSSTIDIWSKRAARMVINDWYLADDYHADHGEGADFYSAGPSRGCGGNGVWAADKLWTSQNFVNSRVLASGPIRVLFELDYDAFDVDGHKVRETKRISLDAGSQLDKLQSTYKWEDNSGTVPVIGIGIKKTAAATKTFESESGVLLVWEKMAKNAGMQGIAVVVDTRELQGEREDRLNYLVLTKCGPDLKATYWAGFCWDKAGQIATPEAWKGHLGQFVQGLGSPIEISVTGN